MELTKCKWYNERRFLNLTTAFFQFLSPFAMKLDLEFMICTNHNAQTNWYMLMTYCWAIHQIKSNQIKLNREIRQFWSRNNSFIWSSKHRVNESTSWLEIDWLKPRWRQKGDEESSVSDLLEHQLHGLNWLERDSYTLMNVSGMFLISDIIYQILIDTSYRASDWMDQSNLARMLSHLHQHQTLPPPR